MNWALEKTGLLALILTLLLIAPLPATAQESPTNKDVSIPNENIERVILISIDSMGTMLEQNQNENFALTPNIKRLKNKGVYYPYANCTLPSVTQLNHPVMVTGAYPEKLEICGNSLYVEENNKLLHPWLKPGLIKGETIFEAMEENDPNYTSALVGGKNYVGRPIWADYQVAPSKIYPKTAKEFPSFHVYPEPMPGDVPDSWTMDKALKIISEKDLEMMLLHLPWLDHQRHYAGPTSLEAWAQLKWADKQIGRLLKQLSDSDKLSSTLIVLTSDHGQTNLWETVNIESYLEKKGIEAKTPNPEGTFGQLYLENDEKITEATELLRKHPEVRKVWAKDEINNIHLNTPYTGEILVNLKIPNKYLFKYGPIETSPGMVGQHGGLSTSKVPIIFFGPNISRGITSLEENVSLVDIVPTISDITGLPLPSSSQGDVLQQVENYKFESSPSVDSSLPQREAGRVGTITPLLLLISIVFLGIGIWNNEEILKFNTENFEVSNWIKSSLPIFFSIALALTASLFMHYLSLWTDTPGINPNAYLSWTIGVKPFLTLLEIIPVLAILIWASHWAFGGILIGSVEKFVDGKSIRKAFKYLPFMFIPLILSQIIYTLIIIAVDIPPYYLIWLFLILFWSGFGLSIFLGSKLNMKIYRTSIRKAVPPVIIFGILTGIVWIFLLVTLLFPSLLPGLSLLTF